MNDIHFDFIEPEITIDKKAFQPASYMRRTFMVEREVSKAEMSITACGLYKGFMNGHPITDEVFMPGFTYYTKRLQVQTYDVTKWVQQGKNVLAVILGDGWYRGKLGVLSKRFYYGDKTKLGCVLTITHVDGSETVIRTDQDWKATQDGPLRKSDWKDGDIYDARKGLSGWTATGYDDSAWHRVVISSYRGELVPTEGESILEQERFTPHILTTPDGSTVLDFKQNISGYTEFTVTGTAGQTVKLIHGETLDETGNFTLRNVSLNTPIPNFRLLQTVEYTLKDGQQKYKPIFSSQGFRYVKLENWPEPVQPENFTAIAVYSAMKDTGTFECSHPGINQIVTNTKWSQKGNFVDIPMDCPTRERAGWTGDLTTFTDAGSYLMNTYKFLSKWLKDLAVQQRSDGCVGSVVPSVGLPKLWDGSAGWGDAAVIVPHTLHRFYGNTQVLEDQYDSMKAWLAFVENRAANTWLPNRLRPNPHAAYIVDTGYHWGEWVEPDHFQLLDIVRNLLTSDAEIATAYYAYSSSLLAEIAAVLGNDGDAAKYRALSDHIKVAYRHTFTNDGLVEANRQARYVRPVALNLLPEEDKVKNMARLNEMVIANQYKIGTGLLTTQFILQVLTDYGYVDTAYKMVENTQLPGWLYQINRGATTIWEKWDGINESGVPRESQNHYTFGAVSAWFFSHVAGIKPLQPGFQRVQIKASPGGSLTYANCVYHSAAGTIRSAWFVSGNEFHLDVDVPVEAEIHLPDGRQHVVAQGSHQFTCAVR